MRNQLRLPALVLVYAGIDIMAWLNVRSGSDNVTRNDFIAWVEEFLLTGASLGCSARDLYAARCGMVHSYTWESNLTRSGKAVRIAYVYGRMRPATLAAAIKVPRVVALSINDVVAAFKTAVERFAKALVADAKRGRSAYERAGRWFGDNRVLRFRP